MESHNENLHQLKNKKKRKIEVDTEENETENDTNDLNTNNFYDEGINIRSNNNDIYFYTGINKKNIIMLQKVTQKVADLIVAKALDAERLGYIVEYPPIKLHINSPGGHIYQAFAYIDFLTQLKLKNNKIKIHTIIEGGSASAATLISVFGDRRYITEYGYMLIHQLSGVSWGTYENLKDDMKNSKELMARIIDIYERHTKLSQVELKKILKHDIYWNAEKSLKSGLVDEILRISNTKPVFSDFKA